MSNFTLRERFVNAITDHKIRVWVYKEARRILPNIGSRCALTAWLFCDCAGLWARSARFLTYTVDLERALLKLGCVKIVNYRELKRGDICFSKDKNQTPGPDHVYVYYGKAITSSTYAMVIDNYKQGPHERNLLSGPKTPFAYALRLPG